MQLRFKKVCERALAAAVGLASRCSGIKDIFIETSYRRLSGNEALFQPEPLTEDELDENEDCAMKADEEPNCSDLITRLQDDGRAVKEMDEGKLPEDIEEVEMDLDKVSDKEELIKLLQKDNPECVFRSENSVSPKNSKDFLPTTLSEVLELKDLWNGLFRLNLRLRSTKGV